MGSGTPRSQGNDSREGRSLLRRVGSVVGWECPEVIRDRRDGPRHGNAASAAFFDPRSTPGNAASAATPPTPLDQECLKPHAFTTSSLVSLQHSSPRPLLHTLRLCESPASASSSCSRSCFSSSRARCCGRPRGSGRWWGRPLSAASRRTSPSGRRTTRRQPSRWRRRRTGRPGAGPRGDGISRETGLADSWPEGGPRKLWSASVGLGYASPVAAGGRVYLFSLDDRHDALTCFDARTGHILWNEESDSGWAGDFPGTRATPAVDGNAVYTFGGTGELTRHDANTGKPVWRFNVMRRRGRQAARLRLRVQPAGGEGQSLRPRRARRRPGRCGRGQGDRQHHLAVRGPRPRRLRPPDPDRRPRRRRERGQQYRRYRQRHGRRDRATTRRLRRRGAVRHGPRHGPNHLEPALDDGLRGQFQHARSIRPPTGTCSSPAPTAWGA